jgi:hypothetical protein
MTVTAASFVVDFPEFGNSTVFPVATIDFWLNVSAGFVNQIQWAALADYATELFIAHNLASSAQSSKQAAANQGAGIPGQVVGPVASKGADGLSVGFDVSAITLTDAGFWNSSTYGIRFYQLMRLIGIGGVQL